MLLACYKIVKEEVDIIINADGSVDLSKAMQSISAYDKNTIEAASQAAAKAGTTAAGLTVCEEAVSLAVKDALARGLSKNYAVQGKAVESNRETAHYIAEAVKKIAEEESVEMVLCSEGAGDTFARQTAPRVAAALDWPVVTSVCKMEIEGNVLTATRKLEDTLETVTVALPAVVSVLSEICPAPIPGLKAIMAAKKKQNVDIALDDVEKSGTVSRTCSGYVNTRKHILVDGESMADKVNALAAIMKKEGLV